jgi:hypothetical protein
MEWYTIVAIFVLIILAIVLGVILACMLGGQRCSISIQQRQPNHELTRIQQEQERKRQKKLSSRIKRTFSSSPKKDQPLAPVEDVKTVKFTLKMGDRQKESEEEVITTTELTPALVPTVHVTQAELDARQKKRDEIRRKYNL